MQHEREERLTDFEFSAVSVPSAFAQRPTNPALLIPQDAPDSTMRRSPTRSRFRAGVNIGAPASVAFDSKDHMFF